MAQELSTEKQVPTGNNREKLSKRLKDRHPDKTYEDDEAFFGGISDDFDEMDAEIGRYKEDAQALSDMFTGDPKSAAFVAAWRNGQDPTIALLERFGDDFKEALDDPELRDKIAEANAKYVEQVEKNKQLEEEYNKNLEETLANIDSFQNEMGISDEEVDDVLKALIGIVHDGIVGKYSVDTIKMVMKAIKHDTDVEEADRAGEVRGRNARITEKLRKREKGDGIAPLNGRNNAPSGNRKARSIFDVAQEAR